MGFHKALGQIEDEIMKLARDYDYTDCSIVIGKSRVSNRSVKVTLLKIVLSWPDDLSAGMFGGSVIFQFMEICQDFETLAKQLHYVIDGEVVVGHVGKPMIVVDSPQVMEHKELLLEIARLLSKRMTQLSYEYSW